MPLWGICILKFPKFSVFEVLYPTIHRWGKIYFCRLLPAKFDLISATCHPCKAKNLKIVHSNLDNSVCPEGILLVRYTRQMRTKPYMCVGITPVINISRCSFIHSTVGISCPCTAYNVTLYSHFIMQCDLSCGCFFLVSVKSSVLIFSFSFFCFHYRYR